MYEIMTFQLASGVDESSLLALEHRVQIEFAYHQRGFVRRTVGRRGDGRWLVLQTWTDGTSADAGRHAFDAHEFAEAYAALVDDVDVQRYTAVG